MEYKENVLTYEDYFNLRESVGWMNFSKEQTQKALLNSIYTVIAVDDYGDAVGVGRLTGDGMYYMIVDIAVCPDYQKKGSGTEIINMLITYVSRETPVGGRSSIQLIAEKGKESFYEKIGFKKIPHECCGFGMRKVIRK